MEDLKSFDFATLIDMLAAYTTDYYRLETQGTVEEKLNQYKELIEKLQEEIESRKNTKGNTTVSDTDLNFTQDAT